MGNGKVTLYQGLIQNLFRPRCPNSEPNHRTVDIRHKPFEGLEACPH